MKKIEAIIRKTKFEDVKEAFSIGELPIEDETPEETEEEAEEMLEEAKILEKEEKKKI